MEGPITLGGLQRLQQLAQPASAVRCLRAREHEAERCRVAALCREQQRTPALRGSRPRVGFGLEQQRRALRAVVRRRGREDGQHEWRPPARICLRQQRRRGGEQRARDVGMPAQSGKRCGHGPGLEQGIHLIGGAGMCCRVQFGEASRGGLLRGESRHAPERAVPPWVGRTQPAEAIPNESGGKNTAETSL
eukprot:scaffold69065_cov75-Phaeocystis_antarctica.AAC.9